MPLPDPAEAPSLLHLRTLVRVADYRTLSSAAQKMLRTTSVVHDGIKELERQLGVALFERAPGGWKLTAEGQCVLVRARRILAELAVLPAMLGQPPVTVHEQLYLLNARRLIVFARLCRLKNMGRVARTLAISQPAVSAAIKALENGTGKALFERSGHGVQPTEIALAILPAIRRALNELNHIVPDLAALTGALRGKVRIGALPLGRTRLIPETIAELLKQYPQVQVEVFDGGFEQLEADLRGGDLDFVFGALRAEDSELQGEALLEEDLVVLVRAGHPLVGQALDLYSLADAQWILPRPLSPARNLIENCFRHQGLALPRPTVESGDMAIHCLAQRRTSSS
ncbi:LysR family transcriptional regulator of gallate degradation [Pseudomonas duriflava]|uniref:LysR family transcriptional regulator of gallate degradation n=1 Tax=Pseudomonas duriflava TaxID=459528 RepID=A0A562QIX1_9PSED|nr:LysR family transcriptional regulator [Pseudomonas duriflava]TWI56707.1 LysR family transcriptional regulator of gallate degradation [Pseudomonas duriflava]